MRFNFFSKSGFLSASLLGSVLLITACGDDTTTPKPLHIPIKFPYNKTFTVDSSYLPGVQVFFEDTVNSTTRSEFKVLETVIDQLDTITIEKITVDMVTPNTTFDAYTSVNVIIAAEGLPTIEIARNNNLPRNATSVALQVPRHDILAYIRKNNFYINVSGVSIVPTPLRLDMKAEMKFRALARVGS